MGIHWSKEEKEILITNYKFSTRKQLQELLPRRTSSAINLMAKKMGIRKIDSYHDNYRESDLGILLNESHLSYYWIGFLTADGHFSDKNRLRLTLGIKDKNHLYRFAEYIKCSNISCDKIKCCLAAQNTNILSKIKEKFDIHNQKTYNPPNLIVDNNELFLSFFIGFIDGDGNIQKQSGRTDCSLRIKIHSSWYSWLNLVHKKLSYLCEIESPKPKINKQGYVNLTIANLEILQFLKKHITNYDLPVLNRKWELIDLLRISKYRLTKNKVPKIQEMIKNGKNNYQIRLETKASYLTINKIRLTL